MHMVATYTGHSPTSFACMFAISDIKTWILNVTKIFSTVYDKIFKWENFLTS